jgi:hypothetical protein
VSIISVVGAQLEHLKIRMVSSANQGIDQPGKHTYRPIREPSPTPASRRQQPFEVLPRRRHDRFTIHFRQSA